MNSLGRDLTEIASLFIGVAFVALLVGNAKGASTVIESAGGVFNSLLKTVTLQNQYGNPLASGGFR